MTTLLKIKRKQTADEKPSKEENLNIKPLDSNLIGITQEAALQINQLLKEKPSDIKGLRIGIKGGGCSGLTIFYDWFSEIGPKDFVFEEHNAKIVIDKKSLQFLGGSTLHCKTYLTAKEFFLVNNPNEKQCSCGKSFSL